MHLVLLGVASIIADNTLPSAINGASSITRVARIQRTHSRPGEQAVLFMLHLALLGVAAVIARSTASLALSNIVRGPPPNSPAMSSARLATSDGTVQSEVAHLSSVLSPSLPVSIYPCLPAPPYRFLRRASSRMSRATLADPTFSMAKRTSLIPRSLPILRLGARVPELLTNPGNGCPWSEPEWNLVRNLVVRGSLLANGTFAEAGYRTPGKWLSLSPPP